MGLPPVVPPPMMAQPAAPWDAAARLPPPPGDKPLSEEEFYRAQDRLRLGCVMIALVILTWLSLSI